MWQEIQRTPGDSTWAQEILWGWDTTPGIVGLWVERDGRVIRWRRLPETGALTREHTRFRPWAALPTLDGLYATDAPLLFHPTIHTNGDIGSGAPQANTTSDQAIWVQHLTGPGHLRYLVSANHADTLERLLRRALSHTLGHAVERLSAVDPDDLLWLPFEEQYLTLSGQVYFRDLQWDAIHRLAFDLETEGLDPARHRIFLIALRDNRGLRCTLDVAEGQARGMAPDAAEADLLRRFVALVRQHDPDVLENHNLAGFDLPFLMARATHLGVPLALQRPGLPAPYFRRAAPRRAWGGWGSWQSASGEEHAGDTASKKNDETRRGRLVIPGREIIDTLDAVWRYDFSARSLPGHGLKAVARALGVARPTREYIEGAEVGHVWRSDPDRVRRYALDDVDEAAAVSALLGGPAFVLAQMAPRRYERVAEAGPATGILDPLIVRAYLHAGAALPAYRPNRARKGEPADTEAGLDADGNDAFVSLAHPGGDEEGDEVSMSHSGGATYLFAAGVARQVVKCDIASLYPSLIRQHRIAPARDSLDVFLTLVDLLVEQRLAAKRAGQQPGIDAVARKTQEGMAAGLKIVINAAYGYLAAPGLCRLADVPAANEVTAHGRATLDHLCRELVARGVTLLEADTDGVYFAAPEGWTEGDERRCVAEVGQTLPPLVRLEYEARYAAMLSHEVKNYATLCYEGRLTLRGVAFHSRRMEPYGEAFLRQALTCLLAGDIPGVRAAYLETITRLRRRQIPTQEVCVSARLTKTPEQYQRERGKRREAMYEAALASGRSTWQRGERIRYYCVGQGRFALLPERWDSEETTDAPTDPHAYVEALDEADLPPYDANYYCAQLGTLYAQRLASAFAPDDFAVLFANPDQPLLFAPPLEAIQPRLTQLALLDRLLSSTPQSSE